jgi:hypothetical protein
MNEGGNIVRTVSGTSYKEAESIQVRATKGNLEYTTPGEANFHGKEGGKQFGEYDATEDKPLEVIKIDGPFDENNKKVSVIIKDKFYSYKVVEYNRKPKPEELKTLKWSYQYDDKNINLLGNVIGSELASLNIPEVAVLKKVTVYAHFAQADKKASLTVSIKDKVNLYLIFYISEEHKGKYMISEAAQTRVQNIKKQSWYDDYKHKAFCIPIQSPDEIITQVASIIAKHGGKEFAFIKEIGITSHAGGDGPISYNKQVTIDPEPKFKSQMLPSGWGKIETNWATIAKFVFYGCNTGSTNNTKYNNFAEAISLLSNFKDVEVWGQSTSSFPSFYPDKRFTSLARSTGDNGVGWDVAETYQVAGNDKEGKKALLSPIPINPLNVYKNGKLIKSTHQGVFNDHR